MYWSPAKSAAVLTVPHLRSLALLLLHRHSLTSSPSLRLRPSKQTYCFKERKLLSGNHRATKKLKDFNDVFDQKNYSHILWWKERMELCRKTSTVQLVNRLAYSNLLGLDINLKNGSLKEGTLNWEILQFKSKFPREVLLCRVGDFYEALGIDACILVEYAGLNPFGGLRADSVPRAGCPVVNLRQTLDDLTRNGFSVEVRTRGSPEVVAKLWAILPGDTDLPNSPKGMVHAAGFSQFFDMMEDIGNTNRSAGLVNAFRQFWWETTHSFHLVWGEATVTPYDFAVLTGLQFTERPIFTVEGDLLTQHEAFQLTGCDLPEKKGNGYELAALHRAIREKSSIYPLDQEWGDERRPEAERLARAFVWAGLSDTLFVDGASTAYFSLLEPLRVWENVRLLSWGEAGLAEMYLALDAISRGKAASFCCFQFALEAWAFEVFGCYDWGISDTVPVATYPALLRWVKAARVQTRTREGRCKVTASYDDIMAMMRGVPARLTLFPWAGRFPYLDLALPMRFTKSRKLLVGLTGDALYLGERVSRQHGPDLPAMLPEDPPAEIWFPRKLPNVMDLIDGVDAQPFMRPGDYQTYVATRLRSPQVEAGVDVRGVGGPGYVDRPPLPPAFVDFQERGRVRRVDLDASRAHPHLVLPEGSTSVSAKAYRAMSRAYNGALDMIRQLHRSLEQCKAQKSVEVSRPHKKGKFVEKRRTRMKRPNIELSSSGTDTAEEDLSGFYGLRSRRVNEMDPFFGGRPERYQQISSDSGDDDRAQGSDQQSRARGGSTQRSGSQRGLLDEETEEEDESDDDDEDEAGSDDDDEDE